MHLRFWRPSLSGRTAAKQLISSAATLVLVMSALTTSLFFAPPAAAAARQQHTTTTSLHVQSGGMQSLDVFAVQQGVILHRLSYDNGASWSAWSSAPPAPNGTGFVGTPAVVSEGDGYLRVFARNTQGLIYVNTYSGFTPGWGNWSLLPGVTLIPVSAPVVGNVQNSSDLWVINSDPAVASWGPGRLDVFLNGLDANTGGYGLLHTWAVNNTWANKWEVLGTGYLQGNPAATSVGPGGLDVFVRGGANELEHKWFANGSWHAGWDNQGGYLTSNPVASTGADWGWDVYARNASGGLTNRSYRSWGYWGWVDIDSNTISSAPALAETPGAFYLFALDNNGHLVYNHWLNQWWFGWSVFDAGVWTYAPAAVAWTFAIVS